jgi:hypothetical protein
LETFVKKIAPKYMTGVTVENLVNILKVERAHRVSRVEIARKDRILMEVDGEWKILKVSRLKELVESIDNAINVFPADIKR